MKFTNGKHPYRGKRNDRFKRFFSKLGIKKQKGLQKAFREIEKERLSTQP